MNPNLPKSYADEFSVSVERELAADTGLRISYVRKQMRNDWGSYNKGQVLPLLESPVPCGDSCLPLPGRSVWPYTQPGSGAGRRRQRAGSTESTRTPAVSTVTTTTRSSSPSTGGSLENFFIQTSFDYQWRDERRRASSEAPVL